MSDTHGAARGTLKSYVVGYLLSIGLTLVAYLIAAGNLLAAKGIAVTVMLLALIQLFVQLVFFLHLSTKSQSRWNLVLLSFALIVVIILVGGSLWIMYNLNYNMTPAEMLKYMNGQDSL
jgi:cytochrome o ubiquinol oxidase operon protein cyoD